MNVKEPNIWSIRC